MKKLIIKNQEEMYVKPCSCGTYPEFIQPHDHYTDIWLECPTCGRQTTNTGGYHYAEEIPLNVAKRHAIIEWNKENIK